MLWRFWRFHRNSPPALLCAAILLLAAGAAAVTAWAADGQPAKGPAEEEETVAEAPFYAVVATVDSAKVTHYRIVGLAAANVLPPPELKPLLDKELAAYNDAVKTWNDRKAAFAADPDNRNKRFTDPLPQRPAVRVEGKPYKTLTDAQAAMDKLKLAELAHNDPGKASRQKILRERLMAHFMWGINAPPDWLAETKAKNGANWDVRCAYLSGGAAKPEVGWIKYNQAGSLLAECGKGGQVCWFTFYMLAQSLPADYKPGPAQATPINAKVVETMKSYFGLFKDLMQLCAQHADVAVVVQIEPDEWGHMLLSAGMDPSRVDVKVGATGMKELKGLPDNLLGYAAALERLRNLYAPKNVLLGCNPSGWDWHGSMSGTKFGHIMKQVCPNYELAVFETGDRDKGMQGKPPPYGNTVSICENFDNHIQWIAEFHAASGMPVVVWQVAMGNTIYATCNNTPGHECDNLAQTMLEDYPRNPTIGRYVKAGCIGWLFHGGQGDSTCAWDAKKDGTTNPTAIPGNSGKKALYSDDDGGYLRLRVGAYYKSPYPILAKSSGKAPTTKPAAGASQ